MGRHRSELRRLTQESPGRDPRNGRPDDDEIRDRDAFYRISWIAYLVLAIVAVPWLGSQDALDRGLVIASGSLQEVVVHLGVDLLLGLAAGGLLLGAWALARRQLEAARQIEWVLRQMIGPLDGSQALALGLISGFAEEFFFRGAMLGSLGFGWTLLLFAALHSGPGRAFRLWTLFALLAGALFGGLVLWRGTLVSAVIGHGLVNVVNLRYLALPKVEST